jgi:hypothetical protein
VKPVGADGSCQFKPAASCTNTLAPGSCTGGVWQDVIEGKCDPDHAGLMCTDKGAAGSTRDIVYSFGNWGCQVDSTKKALREVEWV